MIIIDVLERNKMFGKNEQKFKLDIEYDFAFWL